MQGCTLRPWFPPLPEQIVNPEIRKGVACEVPDMSYAVGIVDMPDRQLQEIYFHDFQSRKYGDIRDIKGRKVNCGN